MHAWAEVCHLYSIGWRITGFLQTPPLTPTVFLISAVLRNNYISLLSDLCACVHVKNKWRRKGSHSSSVSGSNCLAWLQTWKKSGGLVHCSVKNAAVLCENHRERVTQIWIRPSEEEEEEEEERKKNILAVWRLSGSVLSRCFLAPLGVFFVMKTLEDER